MSPAGLFCTNLKKAVDNSPFSWYNNTRRQGRHRLWGISSAGRALAWHARGQRFDPAILHQKSTVLRLKYGAFLFTEADFWGLHCFACMSFGLFAENRDVPADKRVLITKETAVQQAAVRRSLLLFQFRGMAIRRSAFFTSHAPAHPQAAPKMAPPRISVG